MREKVLAIAKFKAISNLTDETTHVLYSCTVIKSPSESIVLMNSIQGKDFQSFQQMYVYVHNLIVNNNFKLSCFTEFNARLYSIYWCNLDNTLPPYTSYLSRRFWGALHKLA